jgi:hypothetical protein
MKTSQQIADEENMSVHTVRHFASAHGMKLVGGQYLFDDEAEALIKGRRKLAGSPRSARTIEKKYGCSVEKVVQWAKKNGVKKEKNSYSFTPEEEARFAREKDQPVIGRPKGTAVAKPAEPKRGPGRPRKDKPPKVPGRGPGRPRKDGINGPLV